MNTLRRDDAGVSDLLIVGAGIIGIMTAWRAHERYLGGRIIIVDAGQVGGVASSMSGGHCQPFGRTAEIRAAAQSSIQFYLDLRRQFSDLPFKEMSLTAIGSRTRLETLKEYYINPAATVLDEASTRDHLLKMGLRSRENQCALAGIASFVGDVGQVVKCLSDDLRSTGSTEVWTCVKVTQIERTEEGPYKVSLLDGRVLFSRQIVVAAGACIADVLLPKRILPPDVRVKKLVSVFVKCELPEDAPGIFCEDEDVGFFPRPSLKGWLLSIRSPVWEPTPDRLVLEKEDMDVAFEVLRTYAPDMLARCAGGWVSHEPFTADRVPLVKADDSLPGLAVVGACSGFGFRVSPALAQLALNAIGWPSH